MSKTKELLMMVSATLYPELQEDEQVLEYLYSNDTTEEVGCQLGDQ
jgi:hypothetical protein